MMDPSCRFHKKKPCIFVNQLGERYYVHQLFVFSLCRLVFFYFTVMCVCNLWTSVTWKLLYKQTSVCLYCNEFAIFQLVSNFVQNTRRPRLPEIKGVHLLLVHFYLPVNWMATTKKSSVMVQLAIVGVLTNLVMNCLGHALVENQTAVCQVWHKSTGQLRHSSGWYIYMYY